MAKLEPTTEAEPADDVACQSANAALSKMVRALAIRQAEIDLTAPQAANDNNKLFRTKFFHRLNFVENIRCCTVDITKKIHGE